MEMSSVDRVEGPNLTLRLIQPEDAAYVHGLRANPADNRHLSQVRGTVETQRQWIDGYKTPETDSGELCYVIERKDGINTLIHYPIPPHMQGAYAGLDIPPDALPLARDRAQEVLSLPMGPHLDRENISFLVYEISKTA